MNILLPLPALTLSPGSIELLMPLADKDQFSNHIWEAIYYAQDICSDSIEVEGESEATLWWLSFRAMYGINSTERFHLGMGFRLGQLISKLESLGLAQSNAENMRQLFDAYFAYSQQDITLMNTCAR